MRPSEMLSKNGETHHSSIMGVPCTCVLPLPLYSVLLGTDASFFAFFILDLCFIQQDSRELSIRISISAATSW